MSGRLLPVLCTLILFAGYITANPVLEKDEGLTLRIVHTNDMHARFEETSRLSTPCVPQDAKRGKCYGGFARIATLVREARNSDVPALFLNAGDTYQGTVWYNIYKWEIVTKFLNLLAPDAVSLGNHEFDDGVEGLIPYIQNAKFPIVTANLDLSQQPNLAATKLLNSTVLTVKGIRIGVIGYLTPETKLISVTENVIFKDEVESVRAEAQRLKKEGVNILIALGHSGFNVDKDIAREVEDIDIVIGGHTNTFLYTGTQPDVEVPEGLYPTEVVQKSGRKAYVVQAYAYTKYLGNITVKFDSKGEVVFIKGAPILVDSSIKQAPDVLAELDKLRPKVENISRTEIGKTRVLLDGDSKSCRHEECNLGNLITDAMIDYYAQDFVSQHGWTDTAIAVQNSGSIRSSITRANNDKITMGDVLSVLPFHNTIVKVAMTGEQILSMLEWSVYRLDANSTANLHGAFLQFSGLQVVFDLDRPQNERVVSVFVQCAACRIPSYSALKKNETYNVFINDFLHAGGDGYTMLKDLKPQPLAVTTADALVSYLSKHSPVHNGVEWRINYLEKPEPNRYVDSSSSAYHPFKIMVLLSMITKSLTG